MGTPAPGEPFSEAAGEAVQTAVTAVRLMMAIADAVRRQRQRQREQEAEQELPPAEQAMSETAEDLKRLFPSDISNALMSGEDWAQTAQQLLALRQAGVSLEEFLPRVGEIAVSVRDQVAANAERVAREGTGDWERMLRETLPAGPVREAILSSPAWPDMAAQMAEMDKSGVDVRGLLASAHDEGLGVDQAVAKVLGAPQVPATSRDALLSYGPLTSGLSLPPDLDLSNRERAFRQLALKTRDNERYVGWVHEAMPRRERDAAVLVNHRQWPLLAAQMAQMESEDKPVREHLARLTQELSWEKGPGPQLGSRLVQATNAALRRPLGEVVEAAPVRVDTRAARAQSTTAGPAKGRAAKSAPPAGPATAPLRQEGRDRRIGKTR
ncbi:hypothetical protein ACGFYV_21730 [Streptomyces sp. NPDC048297]|uniref:hypothetical protein n=1 Tax=Streptomyces sp. NPDC048297 TaxID=3365531 RepID=UPI00371FA5EA